MPSVLAGTSGVVARKGKQSLGASFPFVVILPSGVGRSSKIQIITLKAPPAPAPHSRQPRIQLATTRQVTYLAWEPLCLLSLGYAPLHEVKPEATKAENTGFSYHSLPCVYNKSSRPRFPSSITPMPDFEPEAAIQSTRSPHRSNLVSVG